MSLRNKAINGFFWSFGQQFSIQILNFIVSIILARILEPREFGLIGLIYIFISIGNVIIDSGLTSSLIRNPDVGHSDYSTVFFVNFFASVVIYLTCFFSAPLISKFFNEGSLTAIIRVYTISFVINAFSSIQVTRLVKAMNFRAEMIVRVPSIVIGGIVGISMAYLGYGVWSLVWMQLAQVTALSAQFWIRSKWTPDLIFDPLAFRKHFHFGYKILLSGLLNATFDNLYNIVIGKYFSVSQLGYYNRAMSIRQIPVQNISGALSRLSYPMFSSIQDDDVRLKSVFRRVMQQVIFWVAPILICLGVAGEPLFRFLFTEKWLPAVPYFQLLCVGGIMYPLHSYNLSILNVRGRSDLFFKIEVIKKVIIAIGIMISLPFGIYGLLYFQVVSSFIFYIINSWYSGKMLNYSIATQLYDIWHIVALAIVSGMLIWAVDSYLKLLHFSDIARLLVDTISYFSVYLSSSYLLRVAPILELKQVLQKK